jgi:hypothetical protein
MADATSAVQTNRAMARTIHERAIERAFNSEFPGGGIEP